VPKESWREGKEETEGVERKGGIKRRKPLEDKI